MARERLTDAITAVAHFLVADVPLGETLHRIAVLARDSIAAADAVAVTLLDEDERYVTAVFTDEISPSVDRGQYEDGAGPCLDAFREGRVLRVEDIDAVRERWPGYHRQAVANGVRSTLSVPLTAASDRLGVINLYATGARPFDDADEADAVLFATQAAVVLANARAYWSAFDLAAGLQTALESRATIEQAKGKIMAINDCSPDDAFKVLVRASQRENVKLRELARRIVEGAPIDQVAHGGGPERTAAQ